MIVMTMLEPFCPQTHDVRTTVADGPSINASRSPINFDAP
jgi:hypothetical protein